MKEMKFLELKQGSMTVAEYVARFENLVRYFPHYQGKAGERFKCVKFINGLRPEVKMMVNCHDIHNFSQLTNMCRIFDEDQREKVTFYKNANARHGKEKKPVTHSYAKLYTAPLGQYGNHFRGQRTGGFQPASGGLHPTGGSSQLVNRCLSLLVEVAVVVLLLHLLRHPVVLSVVGLVILLMSAQIVM